MKNNLKTRSYYNETEILQQCSYYYDLAYKIFEFLKPMICIPPIDPILYIRPDERDDLYGTYGHGCVELYLITLFKKLSIDYIACAIFEVLLHELIHSTQVIDYKLYLIDEIYANQIENATTQQEKTFFSENETLIYNAFPNIRFTKSYMDNALAPYSTFKTPLYKKATGHYYWMDLISFAIRPDSKTLAVLNMAFTYSTISIYITGDGSNPDINQFIKIRGKYIGITTDMYNLLYNILSHVSYSFTISVSKYAVSEQALYAAIITCKYTITGMRPALCKIDSE